MDLSCRWGGWSAGAQARHTQTRRPVVEGHSCDATFGGAVLRGFFAYPLHRSASQAQSFASSRVLDLVRVEFGVVYNTAT